MGISLVALLTALGMGGYYIYLVRKEGDIKSPMGSGQKVTFVEKERVVKPVTQAGGVKPDEIRLPDTHSTEKNETTHIQVCVSSLLHMSCYNNNNIFCCLSFFCCVILYFLAEKCIPSSQTAIFFHFYIGVNYICNSYSDKKLSD